jgi:hypothetical protein
MAGEELAIAAGAGAVLALGILVVVSKGIRADIKADEELFMARVRGFELRITSGPKRVRARWVAAIAGFKAGWKSITK